MNENFQNARDLFVQGIEDSEAGRLVAAEAKFQSSLLLLPGRVSTLTNLAATLIKLGRPEAALGALDQALAVEADNPDAWFHRGVALGDLKRFEDALAAFARFLRLRPEHAGAWFRHGQTLQQLERHEQALLSYDKALAIDPSLALAWSNRGGILKDLQRPDEAAASFRQAITHGADAELNGYFLASVQAPGTGPAAPATAPAHYVQHLFDNYAETFDAHLVQVLHYQAHTVLVRNLQGLHGDSFQRALDLGCGTGLCGPLVQPFTQHIDGVDLSPNMLAKAGALKVYQRLVQADVVDYLQTTDQRYDLVLAADVFIYVGNLEPVFHGAARVMDSGGVFCFSVETPHGDTDVELKTSLRYGHSERYVRAMAEQHGFDVIKVLHQPIREDQRQPIAGLYVYLGKR